MNEMKHVKVSDVVVMWNPRTYFDGEEMAELEASIRANGVMQPIVVRERAGGGYALIAGERRLRATKTVHGDEGLIPAMIRGCSEEEAEVLALAENATRSSMSAAEEGAAAQKIVMRLGGNKEEAAAQLGWTMSKLDRRLALMRLAKPVREALNERKILLGHAELLAAVEPKQQEATLEKIIAHKATVSQVRQQLAKLAQELVAAVFDKSDCTGCQYSTADQSALFGESLSSGYCTNPACWSSKTEAHVQGIAEGLKETYQAIKIVRAGETLDATPLQAQGRLGVGEEQAKACKGCGNFGCTVSALPESAGEVERDLCFDTECRTEKIALNMAAMTKSTARQPEAEGAGSKGGPKVAGKTEKVAQADKGAGKKSKSTVSVSVISTKVKEYRLETWRKVAAKVMYSRPAVSSAVLIALALCHKGRDMDATKIHVAVEHAAKREVVGFSLGAKAAEVLSCGEEKLAGLVNVLAPSAMKACSEAEVVEILALMDVDLSAHWKLDEEFLGLLTKSEMEALANELGLSDAMGEKAMGKWRVMKREEMVKALLKVDGFEYEGKVPEVMKYLKAKAGVPVVDGAASSDSEVELDAEELEED